MGGTRDAPPIAGTDKSTNGASLTSQRARARGTPTKAEREIKKLKAQIEELEGGNPEPAQENGSRDKERDDTPETSTKRKGAGIGRRFNRDAP